MKRLLWQPFDFAPILHWDSREGKVVCKQLGFQNPGAVCDVLHLQCYCIYSFCVGDMTCVQLFSSMRITLLELGVVLSQSNISPALEMRCRCGSAVLVITTSTMTAVLLP